MSAVSQSREPWWVVLAEITSDEWASAAVNAPTEDAARADGERIIASQEATADFDVKRVRGPFPHRPGEAAVAVRPNGCQGCGLHTWPAEQPPCPRSTWFERGEDRGDSIAWECIQCGTLTVTPKERGASA
jgi:hypothetical protein